MYFETGKRLREEEMMAEEHHIGLEVSSLHDNLAMQTYAIGEMDLYDIDTVEEELKKALKCIDAIREGRESAKQKTKDLRSSHEKETTIIKFPFFVKSIVVIDEDGNEDVVTTDEEYRGKEEIEYTLDSAVPFDIDLEDEDEIAKAKERIKKSIESESKTNYMDEPHDLY